MPDIFSECRKYGVMGTTWKEQKMARHKKQYRAGFLHVPEPHSPYSRLIPENRKSSRPVFRAAPDRLLRKTCPI